ncbi:hypothetical protein CYMTET_52818, partial [Cymbomonas tetramitiformis]
VADAPPNVTLRTSSAVGSAYVEVKQHGTYEKCAERGEDRAEVLCEPGASAEDAEDGDLAARLLTCPPASCLSYGCHGHEWVTKGLSGCINTTAEVGTVFEIEFVVFDSMVPAQKSTATRFVTITQPCPSGEELCSDMTCSPVSCAERDAVFASSVDDTIPPAIELLQADPVRVIYGNAAAALVAQPCSSLSEGSEGPPYSCLATASDDISGDVSPSISATQDLDCDGCSPAGCSLQEVHQCFPGTYEYLLRAFDDSNNIGYAKQQVKVIEAAMLSTKVNVSTEASDLAAAEAQAAALLAEDSSEATAFKEGIATLLNAATTAPGELVLPGDVAITDVLVKSSTGPNASSSPPTNLSSLNVTSSAAATWEAFCLEMHFNVDVGVAAFDTSDRRRRRRRRLLSHLVGRWGPGGLETAAPRRFLTEELGQPLDARSDDVAAVLVASTQDGSMSAALATAAEANNASLATEVADLSDLPSATRLTSPVDEEAAYATSISQTVESLQRGTTQMGENLRTVQETVALAGGDADQWEARIADLWEKAQEGESENIDELSAGVKDLEEKVNRSITEYAVIPEDSNEMQAELITAYYQMLDAEQDLALQAVDDSSPEEEEERFCGTFSELDELQYRFTVVAPSPGREMQRRRQLLKVSSRGSEESRFHPKVTPHPGKGIGRNFQKFADEVLPEDRDTTLLESKPVNDRARYLLRNEHRLAAGMLFYVVRSTLKDEPHRRCSQRFAHLRGQCHPQSSPRPYARDPVFLPASRLFRSHLQKDIGRFYNTTPGSDMLDPLTGRPTSLVPRALPGNPEGHPFFIDAGLGGVRAKELYTFLEDAPVVDDATLEVTVKFAVLNPNLHSWTFVQLTWQRQKGDWATAYVIQSVALSLMGHAQGDGGSVGVFGFVFSVTLHLLWLLFTLWYFGTRLWPCVAAAASCSQDQGSREVFRRDPASPWMERVAHCQPNFAALLAHLAKPRVLLDLFTGAVHVFTLVLFVFVYIFINSVLTMESHYDIYDDLYADANFFLSYRTERLDGPTQAAALREASSPRWALPEDNAGLERYVQHLSTVQELAYLIRTLFNMHCFGMTAMLVQIGYTSIKQNRLGVIMSSIRTCFLKFMDIVVPFFTIVFCFATLYQIEHGHKSPHVATFQRSLDTLAKLALLGDLKELEVTGWAQPLSTTLLHWAYESVFIFVFSFCMCNFLFAQISDVLLASMREARNSNTVMQDLRFFYRNRVRVKILRQWPRMERIVALLESGSEHHHRGVLQKTLKRSSTIAEKGDDGDMSKRWSKRLLQLGRKPDDIYQYITVNAKTDLHDGKDVCGCNSSELAELLAAATVLYQHRAARRRRVNRLKVLKDDTEATRQSSSDVPILSSLPKATELSNLSLVQTIADSTPVEELVAHVEGEQRFLTAWVADAITANDTALRQIALERGGDSLPLGYRKEQSVQKKGTRHVARCIAILQRRLVASRAHQLETINKLLRLLHKAESAVSVRLHGQQCIRTSAELHDINLITVHMAENEAVVESEGSCIDKHAAGGRHLSQEALVMESVVHWNAPAPHRDDDFIRDALNQCFDGPTWHFTTTDNRAKVHTVSELSTAVEG